MMVSHVASALADHWHSRAVSTEIVPVPPSGPIGEAGALTATAHRSVVGPTTLVEDEDPLHAAINGSRRHRKKRPQVRIILGRECRSSRSRKTSRQVCKRQARPSVS